MIHFNCRSMRRIGNRVHPLHERAAASRAPVRLRLPRQHGVALAAHPFHTKKITAPLRFTQDRPFSESLALIRFP